MPLNNHPSAKPTYDFYDTVNAGRTAVANGVLLSSCRTRRCGVPGGSTTVPLALARTGRELLVQNSVGAFDLTSRVGSDGIRYYRSRAVRSARRRNRPTSAIMDQQQDITAFQSQFNGRFPFTSNGVLVGVPSAGFRGADADDDHLQGAGSGCGRSITRTSTVVGATTSPRRTTT